MIVNGGGSSDHRVGARQTYITRLRREFTLIASPSVSQVVCGHPIQFRIAAIIMLNREKYMKVLQKRLWWIDLPASPTLGATKLFGFDTS
jgi:hypothetical protein